MDLRKSIATTIGVAFALAFPFLNWEPVLSHVPAPSEMLMLATASVLGAVAFGINKRSLEFFHIRGVGWRDIGAAILALPVIAALLMAVTPVIDHFIDSGTASASDDFGDNSLWRGLATAITAGVCEEFIYRGFVIEELGELIRSRPVAAAVSVVFFALAHSLSFGWSLKLIYPGLGGLVITVLYLFRRNLPVCMLLHTTLDSVNALAHWHRA